MSHVFCLLLTLCWVLAHRRGLSWWSEAVLSGDGPYHGILVVVVLGWIVWRKHAAVWQPSSERLGLSLMAVGAILSAWVAPVGLGLLDALAAVVGLVGLVGTLFGPLGWRRSLAVLSVLVLAVPSMDHLEALVGFPVRLQTARTVAVVLERAGWAAVDTGTVLQVEGLTTRVDLPCSGVRSLWTGTVFLAAAASLERRRLGLHSLAALALTWAALVLANGLRVLVLVTLAAGSLPGGEVVAAVVHEPLGLLGFAAACGVGWLVLRAGPAAPEIRSTTRTIADPRWLGAATLLVGCSAWIQTGPPPAQASRPLPSPPHLVAAPVPPSEQAWADAHGGLLGRSIVVENGRYHGVVGEVARVWGADVRTQHPPDTCLRAAGGVVSTVVPAEVVSVPVRTAIVQRGSGTARSMWWFQSRSTTTDDRSERVARGLWAREPWVLVSVLVAVSDAAPELDDPGLQALVTDLHTDTARLLAGPPSGTSSILSETTGLER